MHLSNAEAQQSLPNGYMPWPDENSHAANIHLDYAACHAVLAMRMVSHDILQYHMQWHTRLSLAKVKSPELGTGFLHLQSTVGMIRHSVT